jgi:hypothetical protein
MKYCSMEQLLETATHAATPTIKQIAALMKSGAEKPVGSSVELSGKGVVTLLSPREQLDGSR